MYGVEVCRELRSWYHGSILILSVRTGDADKVTALDLGANDYLTESFSAAELLGCIRALLRRAGMQEVAPLLSSILHKFFTAMGGFFTTLLH